VNQAKLSAPSSSSVVPGAIQKPVDAPPFSDISEEVAINASCEWVDAGESWRGVVTLCRLWDPMAHHPHDLTPDLYD
jgi:hypothetical protein